MQELIANLMTYIVLVSGEHGTPLSIPESFYRDPVIQYKTAETLFAVNYERQMTDSEAFHVEAVYLNGGLILLEEGWNKNEIRDQSILLHELVHFLQEMNFLEFECEGDRERQAYEIQERWLAEKFGVTLYETIDISPLAMVVAMFCPLPDSYAKPGEPGP